MANPSYHESRVEKLLSQIAQNTGGGGGGSGGGGSGGGGIFPVNTVVGEDEIGYIDKTWNEIKGSYDNGLLPVLVIDNSANVIADNPTAENVYSQKVAAMCLIQTYSIDNEPRYEVDFYSGEYYTLYSTDADEPMAVID